MIIKIKTFSGETLYLPEEDYLNEVMYSDFEEREFSKPLLRSQQVKNAAKKAGLSLEEYIARQRQLSNEMKKAAKGSQIGLHWKDKNLDKIESTMGSNKYNKIRENILGHNLANARKESIKGLHGKEKQSYLDKLSQRVSTSRQRGDIQNDYNSLLANRKLKAAAKHVRLNKRGASSAEHRRLSELYKDAAKDINYDKNAADYTKTMYKLQGLS